MIKMLVLDVDGTLTDGKIYTDDKDNNFKAFDVKDGFAIVQWIKFGGIVAIITGKNSNIVKRRGEELGIQEIAQGISNKTAELKKILQKYSNISMEEIAYIGDDLNDLGIIKNVGFSACPIDAVEEVKERVNFISTKKAGAGAVREIIEYLMKKNDTWKDVINHYLEE